MLAIDDPSLPLDLTLLDHKGAFAWWYVDITGADGDSLILIWSAGLPFVPGRRDDRPRDRPSLNIALYKNGRERFYVLQEYPAVDASWSPCGGDMGASSLEIGAADGRYLLGARLDVAIPGSTERLRGTVRLEGSPVALEAVGTSAHRWTPLCTAAEGDVDLSVGDQPLARFRGHAYHDRNQSDRPLDALGIDHWLWARAPGPDGERILYALWPEGDGEPLIYWLHVAPHGGATAHAATVRLKGPRRALYGMPTWEAIDVDTPDGPVAIRMRHIVEDGPFYLRYQIDLDGRPGMGEAVRPGRIDRRAWNPFVRMRIHDLKGPNSPLLPWFSGPRDSRLSRLFGAWTRAIGVP